MKPVPTEALEVNDNNPNTCETVKADNSATLMVPVLDAQNDSMVVKVLTSHEDTCLSYKETDTFVMVKFFPPFRISTGGSFKKCELSSVDQESTLLAQFFNCTCGYGRCLDFYIKISSQCQIKVCDTEIYF